MKKHIHRVTAGMLLVAMPAMQGLAQGTSPIAVKRAQTSGAMAGDDKLTCPQILTEARARQAEFEKLLDQADNSKVGMSARTAGLLAAHEAVATAVPLATPDINPAGMAAVAGTSQAYMESARADERKVMQPIEDRQEFAMARGDYLNDLYRTKCAGKGSLAPTAGAGMSVDVPAMTAVAGTTPAAPAPNSGTPAGGAPNCPALKAEAQKLRTDMNAGVASVMTMAQNYNPAKASAATSAASAAAKLATTLIPTPLSGLVGDAASAAKSAAQKAQQAAFKAKVDGMSQDMAAVSMRLGMIEAEHEEKCGGSIQ